MIYFNNNDSNIKVKFKTCSYEIKVIIYKTGKLLSTLCQFK